MKIQKYGYIADLPDFRDYEYTPPAGLVIPKAKDVFNPANPILDQQSLGCCTGHGTARAFRQEILKQGLPDFAPCRLQIYYDGRKTEGTIKSDSGCQIRDVIKAVVCNGAGDESLWPYVISKFKTKPPAKLYASAKKNMAITYQRVDNTKLDHLKAVITEGYPMVIGFSVYEEFESDAVAKTGIVPMPSKKSKLLGGHCVVLEGFDDATGMFTLTNSWGNWALNGRFKMPYEYLTNPNLASDFWVIKAVN